MLFAGLAGAKDNLQPAKLLLDTGVETFFLPLGFVQRCNLATSRFPDQAVKLADGRERL